MCFASGEDPSASLITNTKRKTHLVEVMNAGMWNEQSFNYVKAGALKIKEKLTGPESTYILRDLFNYHFFEESRVKDKPIYERIYGSILYRENESSVDLSFFKLILRDYINCNIKKILNMDIGDYLELTPYAKMVLDEFSVECSKVINEEVEKMEKANDKNIRRATAGMDMGDLDDM